MSATDDHVLGEEYAEIRISLRLGGPPRVSITDRKKISIREVQQAAQFLEDLTRSYGDEKPVDYARKMWRARQDRMLARALDEAETVVKHERYMKSRPLECIGCRRRFTHQESLGRHVAKEHTLHWLGKRGRTLCGVEAYLVRSAAPGQEFPHHQLCVSCEDAYSESLEGELDRLAVGCSDPVGEDD